MRSLTIYQSQKPLMPFLYEDFEDFLQGTVRIAIKFEVLEKCKGNCKELPKIDLHYVKKKDILAGFGTTRTLIYPERRLCTSR